MKIKFSSDIAYFTGLWKTRKICEGVGISGDAEAQQVFVSEAMNTLGIPPEKIQVREDKVYFYHSAYRKYLQKVVDEELETFRWQNEFSRKFVCGLFDGCGGVDMEKGTVYFARVTDADQLVMERLGLRMRRVGSRIYVTAKCVPTFGKLMLSCMKRGELKSRLEALLKKSA